MEEPNKDDEEYKLAERLAELQASVDEQIALANSNIELCEELLNSKKGE